VVDILVVGASLCAARELKECGVAKFRQREMEPLDAAILYHRTLFPAHEVLRFAHMWGARREVALFIVPRDGGEARVRRFNDYADAAALRADLERNAVARIELGAALTVAPSATKFLRLEARVDVRELVFDVDIDAYDGAFAFAPALEGAAARRCCRGAVLCARCWPLLACAAECLDAVLRAHLGLAHILYVFSGRRGVHVYACDAAAGALGAGARSVVAHTFAALARAVSDDAARLEDLRAILRRYALRHGGAERDYVPRLDAQVSAQPAHLLRAPLAAHPLNGGIALPLALADFLAFDVARAPTAQALCARAPAACAQLERAAAHLANFVRARDA
jgi:DNA primase catalytic subunit